MIYSANITTPKDTLLVSPKRTPLKVTRGLVYKVEVDFPPGSAGLMGVAIFDGGFQVWPSTVGQWFTGDAIEVDFEDIYLKESAPFQFTIYTYNLDDTYEHLTIVRIGLVSKEIYMARFLPHLSYRFFEDMLGRLQIEQSKQAEQQKQDVTDNPFPWLE